MPNRRKKARVTKRLNTRLDNLQHRQAKKDARAEKRGGKIAGAYQSGSMSIEKSNRKLDRLQRRTSKRGARAEARGQRAIGRARRRLY
jgi:hypothetical protein